MIRGFSHGGNDDHGIFTLRFAANDLSGYGAQIVGCGNAAAPVFKNDS
jgi:hypothetical protein